jgi:hypothetical protein
MYKDGKWVDDAAAIASGDFNYERQMMPPCERVSPTKELRSLRVGVREVLGWCNANSVELYQSGRIDEAQWLDECAIKLQELV